MGLKVRNESTIDLQVVPFRPSFYFFVVFLLLSFLLAFFTGKIYLPSVGYCAIFEEFVKGAFTVSAVKKPSKVAKHLISVRRGATII